jgi:hypothetical protein
LANKLKDIEIEEGSLVKNGANQYAKITLFKSANQEVNNGVINWIKGMFSFGEATQIKKAMNEWQENVTLFVKCVNSIIEKKSDKQNELFVKSCNEFIEVAWPISKKFDDETSLNMQGALTSIEALAENVEKAGKAISAANMKKLEEAIKVIQSLMGSEESIDDENMMDKKPVMKGDEGDMEFKEILKSIGDLSDEQRKEVAKAMGTENNNEEIKKALADMQEQIKKSEEEKTELKKRLDAEVEERVSKAFIEQAAEYKHLSTKPEELGKVLKNMSGKLDKEDNEYIAKLLKACDEQIEKSGLFSEIGKTGNDEGNDVIIKVAAKVEEVRKANPQLTEYQAQALVWKSNPDLYDEYHKN